MTLCHLRQALDLTLNGRALLLQGDVSGYAATLAERAPLLRVDETPASDRDQARAIIHQIQAVDAECEATLDAQRLALLREQAALRRERQTRQSYGVASVVARGALVHIDS